MLEYINQDESRAAESSGLDTKQLVPSVPIAHVCVCAVDEVTGNEAHANSSKRGGHSGVAFVNHHATSGALWYIVPVA